MGTTATIDYAGRNAEMRNRYLQLEQQGTPAAKREMARIGNEFFALNDRLLWENVQPYLKSDAASSDDLYAAAAEHLWKVFLKWDPEQATLSVAARAHLSGGVKREVAKTEFSGLSYDLFTKRGQAKKSERELSKQLGRDPSVEEVAEHSGLPETVIKMVTRPQPTSLDSLPIEDQNLSQIIPENSPSTPGETVQPEHFENTEESLMNLYTYYAKGAYAGVPKLPSTPTELVSGIDRKTQEFRVTQARLESALYLMLSYTGQYPEADLLAKLAGTSEDSAKEYLSSN